MSGNILGLGLMIIGGIIVFAALLGAVIVGTSVGNALNVVGVQNGMSDGIVLIIGIVVGVGLIALGGFIAKN